MSKVANSELYDNAAWRINVWFSIKDKPYFQDKGLLAFLYQEMAWIDIENPLHPFTKEKWAMLYKD